MPGVVVVGAGLGGLRASEALRSSGFAGPITVVGDEGLLPYNRPPLSKEALAKGVDVTALEFRRRLKEDDVTWRLGAAATGCDLAHRTLTLADGSDHEFDGLVVATGIRSRRLSIPGPSHGRHLLRTAADATALRPELVTGARLVVLGAGFIGCEVAATARSLSVEVDLVAIDPEPMVRPLGAELGAAMRRRHEAHGVRFHLGTSVDRFTGGQRLDGALLSGGGRLPASVAIEAVGSVPNTEWLEGNGLDLSDGVLTDGWLRVVGTDVPVVAVGDIARHPNALFDDVARRVEHWNMPSETGRFAGATLATLLDGREPDGPPFAGLPSFWSDQYDYQVQSFGLLGLATQITIVDGTADGPCIAEYQNSSGLVGVVGIDRTRDLAPWVARLRERATSS